jgi:hypothetical protein
MQENNLPSEKPVLTSDKTNLHEDNLQEDEDKILTFDEEYPEEELDDETRALIFSKSMEIDIDEDIYGFSKEKNDKKKEKTKKQKDNMTIKQFIDKLDENKPKKWISKRAETKRPLIEKKEKIVERKFIPRLPPFKTLKKEVKPDKIAEYTESNFPTLK